MKNNRTLVLWLLTLVYVVNFIDRQIIGILSPAIKAELGFTDAQLGWLKGFAFALLYVIAGIPIAWLADRFNRARIVTVALAIWSGFTALTGMAHSFAAMLMARIGVGIGEAGGSPPSHSIISDLYPKEQRATALGIYSLGIPIGIGFSYLLAGDSHQRSGLARHADRARCFRYFSGASGLAAGARTQARRTGNKGAALEPASLTESIVTLMKIPSWWAMCMGIAFVSFGGYSVANWGIDYLVRYDPTFAPGLGNGNFEGLMFKLGIINLIFYSLGTYGGAWITEKLAKKNVAAYGWVPGLALVVGAPCLVFAFWVDSINMHLFLLTIYIIAAGVYLGPSFAAAQTLAPINMRAMSTALFFFFLNIIALGGGPTITGIISQMLTPEHGELMGLRLAITCLAIPYALSIIAFFIAAKTMRKDWEIAERRNEVDLAG